MRRCASICCCAVCVAPSVADLAGQTTKDLGVFLHPAVLWLFMRAEILRGTGPTKLDNNLASAAEILNKGIHNMIVVNRD